MTIAGVEVWIMALGNIVLGACVAAAVAAGAVVVATWPAPERQRPATASRAPALAGPQGASPAPAADPAPAVAPAPPPPAAQPAAEPALDIARVEPDGAALFAGRAPAGVEVEVRVGGALAATARAGDDGAFVAFGTAPGGGVRAVEVRRRDAAPPPAAADPVFLAAPAVPGPDAAPTVLIQARPEGVALVEAPPRAPGESVTLDLLSYAEDGAVEVAGRGEIRLPLRIWADATMIAETSVREDGRWSARATAPLAPGAYVLRVEALAPDGRVAFAVSSPFRREAPDRLALAEGDLVIQPGDTLWRIAERRYGAGPRYTLIFSANGDRIRDPDLIYPGQVFRLPKPAAD